MFMDTLKVRLARKRLYRTRAIKLVYIWLICTSAACGASIGETAIGSTSFLVEHNRKLSIIRVVPDPDEYSGHKRYAQQQQ
jgi:hypothetical protein